MLGRSHYSGQAFGNWRTVKRASNNAASAPENKARRKDGCTNTLTIRQMDLECTFVSALADKLRADDMREKLIQSLHCRLAEQAHLREEAAKAAQEQRDEMIASSLIE